MLSRADSNLKAATIPGSVAVSMMSAVYGRQMPANGGQIDNLGAFQRQIFWMCRSDVLRIRLVVLSEATIIEIESDPDFRAE